MPSAIPRSARCWWRPAIRAWPRSCSATIPKNWSKTCRTAFRRPRLIGADREYEALVARVVGLVEAPGQGLDLPLDVRGTAFQERVWHALKRIPVGQTVSYAELARRLGLPKSVRAVASACAANKLAVAIPCHRWSRTTVGCRAMPGAWSVNAHSGPGKAHEWAGGCERALSLSRRYPKSITATPSSRDRRTCVAKHCFQRHGTLSLRISMRCA